MDKTISRQSDERIRAMLCLHSIFRRIPDAAFRYSEGKLWDVYTDAIKAVKDDHDINMDYQWSRSLGKDKYKITADSISKEERPENPRLEEAYNIVSRRPSIRDMETNSAIYQNAIKEYPALAPKDALFKACKEIYLSIDRDLYFFMDEVDLHYKTEYVKRANEFILSVKEEDKAYQEAVAYIKVIEEKGLTKVRSAIFEQELRSYAAIIRMNRELYVAVKKDDAGNAVRFRDYKGIDTMWAEGRIPSDKAILEHFLKGMEVPLAEAMGDNIMQYGLSLRRYEALLDKIENTPLEKREGLLKIHTSDILYGFGFAKWKEEKENSLRSAKQVRQEMEQELAGR